MFSNISASSIRHPIPAIVLFILLTFAGFLGFEKLGINQYPDVDIPFVMVTITEPGAAPAEFETEVTRVVENAVATVGGVAHIQSFVSDGVSTTSIEFAFGKNIDRALNDVRDAVTRTRSELPGDINEPVITRLTTSGGPMLTYVVRAPDKTPVELSWFIDNDVAKTLLMIPGVGQVKRVGGVDREIRIDLNTERLNAYGITAAEVSRQLRAINANVPGGKATVGQLEQSIRTLGSAGSVEALRSMQITLRDGRAVRLSDLGAVEDSFAEPTQDAFANGDRVVAFQVLRAIGSSTVDVSRKVDKAVAKLSAEHPDIDVKLFSSTVDFTLESYYASIEALLLGALLAVIVVFWFLRDWRATMISAIAMPLSVIPTFFFMQWMGFTLNVITLLGLSLVVGILVDDAIVEVENIVRHMRMGKSEITQAVQKLPSIRNLPPDVKQTEYGDAERMNELFSEFGLAIVAGVLLVYCVLVLLFHDFAQPATIMAALPLSVGGALGLPLIAGEALSLPAIIGILMLMGIVTKNSILLVEYALVELNKGASRRAAMLDACSKRARPIVMTTVAMGAGMLPIALKIGADADFRAPMAIAVVGGLVTSTVLSLFYVPIVFTYVDDAKRWLKRMFGIGQARTMQA